MFEANRRQIIGWGMLWSVAASLGLGRAHAATAGGGPALGPAQPFDFDRLRQRSMLQATRPYVPSRPPAAEVVQSIDFDTAQKVSFRPEYELWPDGPGAYPVRCFHLNKYVERPVRIHAVSGGEAREVLYSPEMFAYGDTGLAAKLPEDLGFAGFRLMTGHKAASDWLAFQGASYFRTSGDEDQYGASARGIAINSGMSISEEFPRFTEFWLEAPQGSGSTITIYALLDGESVTGTYRFEAAKPHGAVIDVHAELFFRQGVRRLGLAPLTSMFWYGENGRRRGATDWRPEIHDNDGLALWTGSGERIWRPLVNPPGAQTNSFLDRNPKGFGLLQRDRDFDHYQDDGAFYHRRPGIWIEPKGAWGEGSVVLVELPTDDEVHDNIVAFWQPAEDIVAGTALSLDYRMYWQADDPHPQTAVGRVVATRLGHGGIPGGERPANAVKFVIDFEGGPLKAMAQRFDLTLDITASRGEVENPYVIKVVGTEHWRAVFDLIVDGRAPVDLRCFLRLKQQTLSETWLYQYHPGS